MKRDAAPAHGINPDEAGTTGRAREPGPRETSIGGSAHCGTAARLHSGARCGTMKNDTGAGVRPRLARRSRCRRARARLRQRSLVRSGCRGLAAPDVIPLGEIQETTPGERISLLRHTPDPLGQTSVELLLHDTPLNITPKS